MSTMTGRSMWLGQCFGVAIALYAFVACGDDPNGGGTDGGNGGTDPQGQGGTNPQGQGGTNPQGQGGTDPQGQGGTNPQGQGGTNPQGQGGTNPQGQGGTNPQGQGGTAGEAGSAGAAGDGGAAGAAGHHAGACEDECAPCDTEDYVVVECDPRCVCEFDSDYPKHQHEQLLACDLDEPCPASTQTSNPGYFDWEDGACLLAALRDRTPGKYRLSTRFADLGTIDHDYTFFLDGTEKVLVLDVNTTGIISGNVTRNYLPVMSCTLKSDDVLDDCVAAGTDGLPVTSGGDDAICAHPADWLEDCEPVTNPECPAE